METLYYNGDIITMENEDDCPEAVLVVDGIIQAVGSYADLLEKTSSNCVQKDLRGKTLMPGFIDGHGHISMAIQYTTQVDLSEAKNFDDLVQRIDEFRTKKDLTHGEIIMGYGYDHNFMYEQKHPDKKILDKISKENPIYIAHASGHVGVVNSAMLNLIGFDETTEDMEGGVIGRYEDSREPNGYLEEMAMMKIQEVPGGLFNLGSISGDFDEAQNLYLSYGVTTAQDGGTNGPGVAAMRELADRGKLKIDVVAYPLMMDNARKVHEENRDCLNQYVNHYKIGGYKILLDGSPQGRTAWMSEPYIAYESDDENYCGYPWLSHDVAEKYVREAITDGQQLLCHCNGDAASEELLNLYEAELAKSVHPKKQELRPVMIHCQTVRDDQLDRMEKIRMIPSIFVAHTWYWGDVHLKNFGASRGKRVSPVKSAYDRGLYYNLHTDTPVVKPKMLHSVWAAANRITRNGVELGSEQCVGVYDALKGITINAAYAYFEEDSKGSIKEGKRADFVVLDQNPLKINKLDIDKIQVLETIKDGVCLYTKCAN